MGAVFAETGFSDSAIADERPRSKVSMANPEMKVPRDLRDRHSLIPAICEIVRRITRGDSRRTDLNHARKATAGSD